VQEQHAQGFHRRSGRSSVRDVGWARTNMTRQLGGRVGLYTSPTVQIRGLLLRERNIIGVSVSGS
jgi:hypothetical protein